MQFVAKPIFHCSEHHVSHDVAAMACRRGCPTYRFTITSIQCERYAQRLAVVAAEFEATRAPSVIAARDGHLAV
ncbi:UNVERIFIED_ORG: hypothetical protein ABIC48_006041 [Burkholderia territorii]